MSRHKQTKTAFEASSQNLTADTHTDTYTHQTTSFLLLLSRTDPVSSKTCSVFYVGRAEDSGGVEYCEYVKQCCKRIGAKCVSLKGREEGGAGEEGEQDEGGGSGGGAGGGEVYTLETALLSSWNRLWLGRE